MSTENRPLPGFLGNLTESEEYKLKEIYLAVYQAAGKATFEQSVGIKVEDQDKPKSSGSKFSFLSSSSNQPESYSSEDYVAEVDNACGNIPKEKIVHAFRTATRADHPDTLMLRFLRARKWETIKAIGQMGHTLHWREVDMDIEQELGRGELYYTNVKPDMGYIDQLKTGKVIIHGRDKQGRPIVTINVCKHDPKAQDQKSIERFTIHIIEATRLCLSQEVSTAALIFNLSDFKLSNMDYSVVKFTLSCFEQYYPECLGYLFIHKAPWVFSGIWSVIKGWLDPVVASKISFTKTEKDLLKFIDADQIPDFLGGKSDFQYKYKPATEEESKSLKDEATREKLIKERRDIYDQFDELTIKWITATDPDQCHQFNLERNAVAERLCKQYWTLDPYIRARTIQDRDGSLGSFRPELKSGGVAQPNL